MQPASAEGQTRANSGLSVIDHFMWVATRRPSATALIDESGSQTFGSLQDRSLRLATTLAARYRRGSRVAIYSANRREWIEIYLACQAAGLSTVAMSPRYKSTELSGVLEDTGAVALFTDSAAHRADVVRTLGGSGVDVTEMGPAYEGLISGADRSDVPPHGVAESLVVCTSGSTSRPKGVRLTQTNVILGNVLTPGNVQGLTSSDVTLVFTSLAHRVAQVRAMSGLFSGGSVVLSNDPSTAAFLEACRRHQVTVTGMVPTIIRDLTDGSGLVPDAVGSVRLVSLTGEGLGLPLRERAQAALPGAGFWTFYASTEAGAVSALPPEEFLTDPDSSGRRMPGVEIRIRPGDGFEGQPEGSGEILVRAGSPGEGFLADGYVSDGGVPFVDADGWYATGDIGLLDEGHLKVLGRAKDVIRTGGMNVAAAEVEEAVRRLRGVRDVAVTAAADERFGERVVAWIVRDGSDGDLLTEATVREHVKNLLADYKQPREVHYVESLPKTVSGKVAKWQLRPETASSEGTG